TFDVLLTDLNIGQPGDGFTVTSAMRRTQPDAVTIIITGFPAFETALQAIREQVDDYVVKPADVRKLVSCIEDKLQNRGPHRPLLTKRLATMLAEHMQELVESWSAAAKTDGELRLVPLNEGARRAHIPGVLREVIRALESEERVLSRQARAAAAQHGQ